MLTVEAHPDAPPQMSLEGPTYSAVQSVDWLDENRFVVARWDGTVNIFQRASDEVAAPLVEEVVVLPSHAVPKVVFGLGSHRFLTSNDQGSFALWVEEERGFQSTILPYDARWGEVVSGDSRNEELVLGHVNGYVTFWSVRQERPVLLKAVDVRSPSPLVLEPQIWHVRGVKFVAGDRVVTGRRTATFASWVSPTAGCALDAASTTRRGEASTTSLSRGPTCLS